MSSSHGRLDHSQKDHSQMDHSQKDHSQMDHSQKDHGQKDHSQMDHSQMDHSQMDHSQIDHKLVSPPSVSIVEKGRNLTLVGKRLSWSDALLYCRDFHWDLLSLRGPEDQETMDELVAGAPFPLTGHLWVGLRRSHRGSEQELVSPPSISIVEKGRNLTLVGKRLSWSDALLYCRDFHWDLLSLRGPEDQETMDELVAGAPFPLTGHLWVGLRRSILGTSWYWMSGDPMDFTRWEQASHQSSPCGGVSSMVPSTWGQRSCEDHLHFICSTGPTEGVNKVHFYSSTREKQTSC
ncbi:hypothetical protein NHX12_015293 [Muraenolepis orangiensis]|uniref:C-type lectin domain-containing protein n=1 Tax=Muraenolepis orangiensis TaxID=630683 RepID=A0A9Q0DA47_9TELE|nr:hypothetical protein NHX12_015293 [Muraenolepis orangiensis]